MSRCRVCGRSAIVTSSTTCLCEEHEAYEIAEILAHRDHHTKEDTLRALEFTATLHRKDLIKQSDSVTVACLFLDALDSAGKSVFDKSKTRPVCAVTRQDCQKYMTYIRDNTEYGTQYIDVVGTRVYYNAVEKICKKCPNHQVRNTTPESKPVLFYQTPLCELDMMTVLSHIRMVVWDDSRKDQRRRIAKTLKEAGYTPICGIMDVRQFNHEDALLSIILSEFRFAPTLKASSNSNSLEHALRTYLLHVVCEKYSVAAGFDTSAVNTAREILLTSPEWERFVISEDPQPADTVEKNIALTLYMVDRKELCRIDEVQKMAIVAASEENALDIALAEDWGDWKPRKEALEVYAADLSKTGLLLQEDHFV